MSYFSIGVFIIGVGCLIAAFSVTKLPQFRHVFCVPEGHAGLLYRDGLYVRRHNAGCNIVWGLGWAINVVDLRKASLAVAAADVLTADNVGLNFSMLVTYHVDDPVTAAHATQDWRGDLHNAAQAALRAIVSEVKVETLLNRRPETGDRVLEQIQPGGARIGISVLAVEVKQIILPEELRQAFANALNAKRSVQGRSVVSPEYNGGR